MKPSQRHDRAFRVAFVCLVAAALVTLWWQCSGRPGGASRIGWPALITAPTG